MVHDYSERDLEALKETVDFLEAALGSLTRFREGDERDEIGTYLDNTLAIVLGLFPKEHIYSEYYVDPEVEALLSDTSPKGIEGSV